MVDFQHLKKKHLSTGNGSAPLPLGRKLAVTFPMKHNTNEPNHFPAKVCYSRGYIVADYAKEIRWTDNESTAAQTKES